MFWLWGITFGLMILAGINMVLGVMNGKAWAVVLHMILGLLFSVSMFVSLFVTAIEILKMYKII